MSTFSPREARVPAPASSPTSVFGDLLPRRSLRASITRFVVVALFTSLLPGVLIVAPAQSAFPGDDGLIAYSAAVTVGGRESLQVFTANPDGSDKQRITSGGMSYDPAFSPNGRLLAVTREDGARTGLWIVRPNGTWVRKVASFPGRSVGLGGGYGQAAWSPDGRQLVFVRDHDLWVVDVNGSAARPLLDPLTDPTPRPAMHDPAWSPDGTRIAFQRWSPSVGRYRLYTVGADGTGMQQLTSVESGNPSWSPDGTRITYEQDADVWVVQADGTNARAVTSTRPGVGREMHPAWSPSGTHIVFHDFMIERGVLSTVAVDGSGRRIISRQPRAGMPDWQPELRASSSISLNYATLRVLRVNGQVNPAHPGRVIDVKLAVSRGGRWVLVASKTPRLSDKSRYVVRFTRPSAFMCRLTARFRGDNDHRPSTMTKLFTC